MGSQQTLRPTITLVASWGLVTLGVVLLQTAVKMSLPGSLAKVAPFLLAGLITGWLFPTLPRRPKIIATAVLALVSALAWTTFGVATNDIEASKALVLFAASLPVMCIASLWAYFGMYLAGRS